MSKYRYSKIHDAPCTVFEIAFSVQERKRVLEFGSGVSFVAFAADMLFCGSLVVLTLEREAKAVVEVQSRDKAKPRKQALVTVMRSHARHQLPFWNGSFWLFPFHHHRCRAVRGLFTASQA